MLVRKVREWKIAENYTRKMERHKVGITTPGEECQLKGNIHRGDQARPKKIFYPKNGHTFAGTIY